MLRAADRPALAAPPLSHGSMHFRIADVFAQDGLGDLYLLPLGDLMRFKAVYFLRLRQ